MKECTNCGALMDDSDAVCRYCNFTTDGKPAADPNQAASPFGMPPPPAAPEPPPPFERAEQPQEPPAAESGQQAPNQQPGTGQNPGQASWDPHFENSGSNPNPQGQPGWGQQQGGYQQPGRPSWSREGQQGYQQPNQQYQQNPGYQQQGYQGHPYGNQQYNQDGYPPQGRFGPYGPEFRNINRVTAGVLAILLGWIGVHKFYMGNIAAGVVMLIFCWTGIPAIVGLIQGIMYLSMHDNEFMERYARFPGYRR